PHRRLLPRPRLRAVQRHLRLLVPAEQRPHVREVGQLAHARVERGPGVDVDHPMWRLPQRQATVSASTAAPGCTPPRCAAAPTKSRNSGCGRFGRDLNSGWYWLATNHGWSGSSITSTSRSSWYVPETCSPLATSWERYWLFTSYRWRCRSWTTRSPYAAKAFEPSTS